MAENPDVDLGSDASGRASEPVSMDSGSSADSAGDGAGDAEKQRVEVQLTEVQVQLVAAEDADQAQLEDVVGLNHGVAGWLARVAEAIEAVGDHESDHGLYYVDRVTVGFDGEDAGYRVVPNEFGGYDVGLVVGHRPRSTS